MKEWTQIFNLYFFGIKFFTKEIIDKTKDDDSKKGIGFN